MSPLLIQLGLSAANTGGTALYNGITGDIENNVNNPAISNYLTNVSAINSQIAEQQAFDTVNSNLQDLSNVNNNDTLLNLGIQQTSTVNEPNGWQNIGMYTGKQLQNLGNLDIVGTYDTAIQMYKDLFNIGNDSKADKINKEITRVNKQNIDNFYNQVTANNKRQQRQAMMNYFAEGGSLEELNGVTTFRGLKHGQFGLEGIPQGIASDGIPNYVQGGGFDKNGNPLKGEIKYKDYIYGKLKITKKLADKYNLPEKWVGLKYQEAADDAQQESKDRPNDPISLKSLDEWMTRLQGAQEEQKLAEATKEAAKIVNNMSDEEKLTLMSSLEQPMAQQEGIDLSQLMYAKGGKIHIKPSKRGTFTAAAKKHGKSVQAFASQVLANKENYSPAMVKKANFARNSAKWHANGGHLFPWGGVPYTLEDDVEYPWRVGFTFDNAVTSQPELLMQENYQPQTEPKPNNNINIDLSNLRYAPAIGAGLGALTAALQPKDYTLSNKLEEIASMYKPIGAPHIGGYRKYTPYDVNLGDVENLALQTAALRANRGQNRATQGALNTAVIAKSQEASAKRNLAAQQANEANRLAVDTYNLGIDKFNAERDSQYDQLNQQILANRINMLGQAAQTADASRTAWANNISSTTENAFNRLGNVGKDNWNRNYTDMLLREYGIDGLAALRQLLS